MYSYCDYFIFCALLHKEVASVDRIAISRMRTAAALTVPATVATLTLKDTPSSDRVVVVAVVSSG